jgi:hypothetical protein
MVYCEHVWVRVRAVPPQDLKPIGNKRPYGWDSANLPAKYVNIGVRTYLGLSSNSGESDIQTRAISSESL